MSRLFLHKHKTLKSEGANSPTVLWERVAVSDPFPVGFGLFLFEFNEILCIFVLNHTENEQIIIQSQDYQGPKWKDRRDRGPNRSST